MCTHCGRYIVGGTFCAQPPAHFTQILITSDQICIYLLCQLQPLHLFYITTKCITYYKQQYILQYNYTSEPRACRQDILLSVCSSSLIFNLHFVVVVVVVHGNLHCMAMVIFFPSSTDAYTACTHGMLHHCVMLTVL